ncbi:hypothetical protein [Martelella limonii]|uniref:hypothetical protein n=1 Tax=Martelella limonii TaxID=1647649 RepID=UPI0019D5A63E|nr:hypothetical protein [Martelella limonii]
MTDNKAIWNRFADINPKYTKPISGKAYKGTSPSPQHVIECLTELFGPVGQGFGWEVIAEGFQPLGDEVLHWCRIRFWHTSRDNTFEEYGQTKALMKTKSGLMSDEDAPKKSQTDAIVKAASHLGIAANIFLGRWDDQKYVADVRKSFEDTDDAANSSVKPSSASMKKQLEEIDEDLVDCVTIADVDKCAKVWGNIMKRDQWPKDFMDCVPPKFKQRRDAIQAASDDGFPGSNETNYSGVAAE